MKTLTQLLFIFLFFLPFSLFSQDCGTIIKKIDLGGNDSTLSSDLSKDGFIYLAGSVSRSGNINGAFVLKTDVSGKVIWSRVITGSRMQVFRKLTATSDSGVITIGSSSTYSPAPNFASLVIKWDKNGNRQWARSLNTQSQFGDWGLGVTETSDGGFLVVGNLNSNGYYASGYAMKLDRNGNAQWAKKFDFFEGINIRSVSEIADGFLLAGEYLFGGNSTYRPLIVKINKATGAIQLIKSFQSPEVIINLSPLKKRQGGYFFNCMRMATAPGNSGWQQVVLYLKDNFDIEKSIIFSQPGEKNYSETNLVPMPDGGFVSATGTDNSLTGADLYRLDAQANITWRRKIDGAGPQKMAAVTQIAGDDFLFAGSTTNAQGEKDILWIRTPTNKTDSSCLLENSEIEALPLDIEPVSFSFDNVSDFPFSLWVNVSPAIEADKFKETYSCNKLEVSIDTTICKGSTAQLLAKGADSYTWSPAAGLSNPNIANPKATVNSPMVYKVTATTLTGCTFTDSVQVGVYSNLTVNAVADRSYVCGSDSVQLTANGGLNYQWSPATGLSNPNIANPKAWIQDTITYSVSVTDGFNCTGTDTVTINRLPPPNFTLTPANPGICRGDSILLKAGGGDRYEWNGSAAISGATDSVVKVAPVLSTIYRVKIIHSPCRDSALLETEVKVVALPVVTVTKSNDLNCDLVSAQLQATGGVKYLWSPLDGLSNPAIANPVASNRYNIRYIVEVTDSNGCRAKDSIDVQFSDFKKLIVTPDTAVCTNQTLGLLASGAVSYVWFPASGLTGPNTSNPTALVTQNITYYVQGTTLNGCVARDSVQLRANPLPTGTLTAQRPLVCGTGSVQMAATGGVNYLWSPADKFNNPMIANPIATLNQETLLKVKRTDNVGCSSQDSLLITWKPAPVYTITPETAQICRGDSQQISVTGGNRFQWEPANLVNFPNRSTVLATPVAPTIFRVKVWTDECLDSVVLNSNINFHNPPDLGITKSNDIDCNVPFSQLSATGGISYRWEPAASLNNPGIPDPVASPAVTTVYRVFVKDALDCTYSDSITVIFTNNGNTAFYQLPTAFTPNKDGLNDCFGISKWGTAVQVKRFDIYNRWGMKVFSGSDNQICWDGAFNGQKQPSGTYVYWLIAESACGNIERKGVISLIR
jgi:gliding motility-associated-like protein